MHADILILSYAKTPEHYEMTQRAIDSIHASAIDTKSNVTVVETAKAMPVKSKSAKFVPMSGLVQVGAKGDFVWRGIGYTLTKHAGKSVWVDDLDPVTMIVGDSSVTKPIVEPCNFVGQIVYRGAKTVPANLPFNYNAEVNRFVSAASSDWAVVCNNDIIANPGWFEAIAASGYPSCSPISPGNDRQAGLIHNTIGYVIGRHIAGWCIATHRSVWDKVFPLDEAFRFYHQDCDYAKVLLKHGIKHAIIPQSGVTHLLSKTAPGYTNKDELLYSTREFYKKWPEEWYKKETGFHSAYWTWQELFPGTDEPKEPVKRRKRKDNGSRNQRASV